MSARTVPLLNASGVLNQMGLADPACAARCRAVVYNAAGVTLKLIADLLL